VANQLLPQDLSTAEAFHMIDGIAACARPIFILSGGEPLFRPDIFDIARYASNAGLIVALATNGTLVDASVAQNIKAAGIRRVSISFDGADAATHDIFRGAGAFDLAIRGMDHMRNAGVPFQINTTVARHNVGQMPETLALAKELGAAALHLFLLVPVGCGVEIAEDQQITPREYEEVLNWMYDAEMEGGIELKATCAPHYFRIVRQRQVEERRQGIIRERPQSLHRQKHAGSNAHPGHPGAHAGSQPTNGRHAMNAMTKGCLAGTGVAFISHRGEVFPCGYLPMEAGHLRRQSFEEVWESSNLFRELRDPGLLGGKCGVCEFVNVCSGCRARAYGMSGDHLGEEPFCTYVPRKLNLSEEVSVQ
jgi:radical SAM protein with 4Fe4S-binding SPASM domain